GDDERIDLSAIAEIVDFTDLVANHLADVGGTAQIQSSQGTILLQGIAVLEIGVGLAYSGEDFVF
ncbi:hypothetical protein DRV85_18880, partial [Rhodosalinus halophilus]